MDILELKDTLYFGKQWHKFLLIDSTNTYLKSIADENSTPQGTIATAKYQTNGRGQVENKWVSNASENMLLSALIKPFPTNIESIFIVNQFFANTVHKFVKSFFAYKESSKIWIKWPNDILVDSKKISGILIENIFSGNQIKSLVFGVGLNINQEILPNSGTSLRQEFSKQFDIDEITQKFILFLDAEFNDVISFSGSIKLEILSYYYNNLVNYNILSQYQLANGEVISAILKEVDEQGRIVLQTETNLFKLNIKEVKFLFPENPK